MCYINRTSLRANNRLGEEAAKPFLGAFYCRGRSKPLSSGNPVWVTGTRWFEKWHATAMGTLLFSQTFLQTVGIPRCTRDENNATGGRLRSTIQE